jgi:O-antigen ligase
MNLDRYRDTILTVSFLTWCVLLSFPMLVMDTTYSGSQNSVPLYQVIGAAQFAMVALIFRPPGNIIGSYDPIQISVLVIIFLSLGLQLHDEPVLIVSGIAYTIALMAAIVALSFIFTMPTDAMARCFGGAAVVFFTFGVSALALFGWPQDRYLGPIHPNLFGSVMLSGFIFSQFHQSVFFMLVRITCFGLAAIVSTRFALIGCLLALLVFELTLNPFNVKLLLLAILAAACLIVFHQQIIDILALDDPARGAGSGFTGRDVDWATALDSIADNPFGMGFKRPPFEGAGHNGYLKILLEFGIFGGGLIIAAVLSMVVRALFEAVAGFREDSRLRRIASARAGGLVALIFATFFQPQMFNLGDVHGISLMLLLFRPGRALAGSMRLRRQETQFWNRPVRAPFWSPGDQG